MLDIFFDEGLIAGFRQGIPELPGGAPASRASRKTRTAFFDQRPRSIQNILSVLAGDSDHVHGPEATIPSPDNKVKA